MRTKYIFLLLLLCNFQICLGQQEDLNRTWFLYSLEIGGEEITIPDDTNTSLSIDYEAGIYEGVVACNSYDGAIDVFATDELNIDTLTYTLAMCDNDDQEVFTGIYFQFLGNSNPQEFNYSIFVEEEFIFNRLTLTHPNGDIAIYGPRNGRISDDITQEPWYLDSFEVEGVAQNYPSSDPNQYRNNIQSTFDLVGFDHDFICVDGGYTEGTAYSYFGELIMEFGSSATLALDCNAPQATSYDYEYLNQLDLKKHSYEIIEEGQGRRMILTDENGDRTFYENAFLNLESFEQKVNIQLSPNPATEYISISGNFLDSLEYTEIYNLQGQLVRKEAFTQTININELSQGLYFLKLHYDSNQFITEKFIKK